MNNLKNITEMILTETQNTAANIKAAAEKEKERIIADAQKRCGEIKEENAQTLEAEIKNIQKRADAARYAGRRTRLLEEKQNILSEIIKDNLKKTAELSGAEYEEIVLELLKKHLREGSAVIFFPNKRKPSRKLLLELDNAAKAAGCRYIISDKTEKNIENGFIIAYGDIDCGKNRIFIEENCTFAELFNDNKDEIYAESARILFGAEEEG